MALPGFRNHPKFRRLVAALHIPEAHVLGHIEMMWEVCYESGNAILGDSTDVELAAGWVGDAGVLCAALAECGGKTRSGLIEEVGPGIWAIHDFYDHASMWARMFKCSHLLQKLGLGDPRGWGKLRVRILERDGFACRYCGALADTVDHVIPRSHNGSNEDWNLVAACRSCNSRKHNRTPVEAGMPFLPSGVN